MNEAVEISIVDLNACFKRLKHISCTNKLYYKIEHPSQPDIKLEFVAVMDYMNGKNIWRLNESIEVVSDYE